MSSAGVAIINSFALVWKIFLYGIPFWFLGAIFVWKKLWGQYSLEAIIIEKKGDNLVKTNDRVGKTVDKYTGLISYKLQKCKDSIPVYNFDWIMHNVIVNTNIFEKFVNIIRRNNGTIFLFRYGSKQYKPINIMSGKEKISLKAMKDKLGKDIYINQYQQFDLRGTIGALDFEVVDWDNINFMVQEQRATMERRKAKGDFFKSIVVPLMALIVVFLLCLFMMKFSVDYSREVRGSVPVAPTQSKIGGAIGDVVSPGQ